MTIEDIITLLSSKYVPLDYMADRPTKIGNREITNWCEEAGLSRSACYDAIALKLAQGFQSNAFEYSFCDEVVNDIHSLITMQNEDRPELFWNIFLAFDAGEFYHNNDRSIDPVEAYTRPQITEILRNQSAN
jgi:hypothetical protein